MSEGDPPITDMDIEILSVLIKVFCGGGRDDETKEPNDS